MSLRCWGGASVSETCIYAGKLQLVSVYRKHYHHSFHPSPAQVIQFTPTRSRPNLEVMSASLKDRLSTNSSPPTSSFLGSNAAGSRKSKNRYRCGFELGLSPLEHFLIRSRGITYSSFGPGARYLVIGGLVSATWPLSPLNGCRPVTTQCRQNENLGSSGVGASGSTSMRVYAADGDSDSCI